MSPWQDGWAEFCAIWPLDPASMLWVGVDSCQQSLVVMNVADTQQLVFASSLGQDRSYSGLDDDKIYWLVTEKQSCCDLWVPNGVEAESILANIHACAARMNTLASPLACMTGKQRELLSNLVPISPVEVAPSRFVAVRVGDSWSEVMLCKPLSADGERWLCRTTSNWLRFEWTLVKLAAGGVLAPITPNGRRSEMCYGGVLDSNIDWMCVADAQGWVEPWEPTASELDAMQTEAEVLLTQLGSPIPDHMYCGPGTSRAELSSIEELLLNTSVPAPGKFAMVLRKVNVDNVWQDGWQEVLLCKPLDEVCSMWLSLTNQDDEDQNMVMFWSVVQLRQNCFTVVEGIGAQRRASQKQGCFKSLLVMAKPGCRDLPWTPTPKRVQKALTDADALHSKPEVRAAVQAVLAAMAESLFNPLPVVFVVST